MESDRKMFYLSVNMSELVSGSEKSITSTWQMKENWLENDLETKRNRNMKKGGTYNKDTESLQERRKEQDTD